MSEFSGTKGGSARAIQILSKNPEHSFELDDVALEKVLLRKDIKDLPVAVISVVGAVRKGKSFLLDFFIRYLRAEGRDDWLGDENSPLEGFSWRGGAQRDTTGILLWSEVFRVKTPSGEEIAVILMDTQGAFDSGSTVRDCATIFALSTMTSSVQIYNLTGNIQGNDLQHLQLFTEYGRLALEDCGDTPFQNLQFLVRDWSFPYDVNYGAEGGRQILERCLEVKDRQHDELQSLRKHIRSCFSDIFCFLMPHPGLRVATNPAFDGRLADIAEEFIVQLCDFVPFVLSPQNLVVKRISGQKVRVKDLVHYFRAYSSIYQREECGALASLLKATAEANNLSAVASAKDMYVNIMEEKCGGGQAYMAGAQIEAEHASAKERVMEQFQSSKKMGGSDFSIKYLDTLEKDVEELFINYRAHNESKNIFKSAWTPATLFTIAGIFYVLSGFFGLMGMYSFANMFNLLMGVVLLTLAFWAYTRYSGELREFGSYVDIGANFISKQGSILLFWRKGIPHHVVVPPANVFEQVMELPPANVLNGAVGAVGGAIEELVAPQPHNVTFEDIIYGTGTRRGRHMFLGGYEYIYGSTLKCGTTSWKCVKAGVCQGRMYVGTGVVSLGRAHKCPIPQIAAARLN